MSTWLTSNAPGWLVLVLVGLAVTAYLACGVLALIGRVRRTVPERRRSRRPALPRARARAGQEVTS
jgi:hypothetical protein